MSYRIPCKNPRRKTITEEHRTPKTSTSAPGRRWVYLKKPNDDRERERAREGYRSGWPSHSLQRLCARRESGVEFLRLFLRLSVAVRPSVRRDRYGYRLFLWFLCSKRLETTRGPHQRADAAHPFFSCCCCTQ